MHDPTRSPVTRSGVTAAGQADLIMWSLVRFSSLVRSADAHSTVGAAPAGSECGGDAD
jgi:hypothetical protein